MQSKTKLILVAAIINFLLFIPQIEMVDSQNSPFTVLQDPEGSTLIVTTPLNLTIISNQQDLITSVVLLYCSLDPDFLCHFPLLDLEENAYGYFSTLFTPEYEIGTTMGYHLKITMENETIFDIPDSLNYPSSQPIQQATDDHFYFTVQIISESETLSKTESTTNIPGLLFEIINLTATSIIIRKMRKLMR